jgi:hypothetical protein
VTGIDRGYAPATTALLREHLRRTHDWLAHDNRRLRKMPARSTSRMAVHLRNRIAANEIHVHDLAQLLSITEGSPWVADWPARVAPISLELYTLYVPDIAGAYVATVKRYDGADTEQVCALPAAVNR